jgi:hypothetical protein
MKKNYINPTITIVDLNIEALMVCTSCNIKTLNDNTGAYVQGKDITDGLSSGNEVDAGGYRNNLWGD